MQDVIDKRVKQLAADFDCAYSNKDLKKTHNLILQAIELTNSKIDNFSLANLYYSIGTAYSDCNNISVNADFNKNLAKQMLYFRKTVNILNKTFDNSLLLHVYTLKCKVFTNYSNTLNIVARPVLSIKFLLLVLEISKNFGMALGNLGAKYFDYALLFDNHFFIHIGFGPILIKTGFNNV